MGPDARGTEQRRFTASTSKVSGIERKLGWVVSRSAATGVGRAVRTTLRLDGTSNDDLLVARHGRPRALGVCVAVFRTRHGLRQVAAGLCFGGELDARRAEFEGRFASGVVLRIPANDENGVTRAIGLAMAGRPSVSGRLASDAGNVLHADVDAL